MPRNISSGRVRVHWVDLMKNPCKVFLKGLTCVCIGVSGQGALWGAMTPVPVPAASSVPPLLRNHPFKWVIVQSHTTAWTTMNQAGCGAPHRTGVGYGLWDQKIECGRKCRKDSKDRKDRKGEKKRTIVGREWQWGEQKWELLKMGCKETNPSLKPKQRQLNNFPIVNSRVQVPLSVTSVSQHTKHF